MQEAFYCVYLDRKNHPLGRHLITLGTVDSTVVAPREVFRGAILASASALIVAHNHPSGDPAPSQADISVTRTLREAAKILQIELLDHVVVGDAKSDLLGRGFFSFREGRPALTGRRGSPQRRSQTPPSTHGLSPALRSRTCAPTALALWNG